MLVYGVVYVSPVFVANGKGTKLPTNWPQGGFLSGLQSGYVGQVEARVAKQVSTLLVHKKLLLSKSATPNLLLRGRESFLG